jgi:hypothetical protein
MALIYTDNTSVFADILEETLDQHPSWRGIVDLFLGRIQAPGDERLPLIHGGAAHLLNFAEYRKRIGIIGRCASKVGCPLFPPISCYRCEEFRPVDDPAPHRLMMEQVFDELRANTGFESDRMMDVFRPDLLAMKEVVEIAQGGQTPRAAIQSGVAREVL